VPGRDLNGCLAAAPLTWFCLCAEQGAQAWAYSKALASSSKEIALFHPAQLPVVSEEGMVVGRPSPPHAHLSAVFYLQRRRLRAGRFRCACSPTPGERARGPGLGVGHAGPIAATIRSMGLGWMWPPRAGFGSVSPASTDQPFTLNQEWATMWPLDQLRPGSERPWGISAVHLRLRLRLRIPGPPPDHWTPSSPACHE